METSNNYDNCKLISSNGILAGYCSYKKMLWYLKKGIACKINENTIKLNFIPKSLEEILNRHCNADLQILNPEQLSEIKIKEIKELKIMEQNGDFDKDKQLEQIKKYRSFALDIQKKDICVICGNDNTLISHSLVPREFKKEYPLEYKVHRYDLIVTICDKCRDLAQSYDNE
jgi:hypothetical protein